MKQNVFLLLTALTLTACGQADSTIEETCVGNCSETEINAPVSGTEEKEEPSPPQQNFRMPDFNPSWGLKKSIYDKAVAYFETNYRDIPNHAYVTIIDFSLHSSKKRLFLFDLANGKLERHLTSHGAGSDANNDGYAESFSNIPNSKQSSLGFYLTLSTYSGKHGYSLRIRGLESSNSNAEDRAIVIHPADYVQEKNNYAGRSWGCPALDPSISKSVIDKIKSGSLILIDK